MTRHRAAFADLDPAVLYALLRLRSVVFGIEQDCLYLDLDDRDQQAVHAWAEEDGRVVAGLRVLTEPDHTHVGRIVTDAAYRGRGIAAALIRDTLAWCGRPVHIEAQSQLVDWYAGFGFVVRGPEYVEDGIPHTPMRYSGPSPGSSW